MGRSKKKTVSQVLTDKDQPSLGWTCQEDRVVTQNTGPTPWPVSVPYLV